MNKRRLLKLAEFLETANIPIKFDMAAGELGYAESAKAGRPECGTAACALGWATAIPSFRRAGLRFDMDGYTSWPIFREAAGYLAGAAFFEISGPQASGLFVPTDIQFLKGKRGRRIVARRIRKLVESAP